MEVLSTRARYDVAACLRGMLRHLPYNRDARIRIGPHSCVVYTNSRYYLRVVGHDVLSFTFLEPDGVEVDLSLRGLWSREVVEEVQRIVPVHMDPFEEYKSPSLKFAGKTVMYRDGVQFQEMEGSWALVVKPDPSSFPNALYNAGLEEIEYYSKIQAEMYTLLPKIVKDMSSLIDGYTGEFVPSDKLIPPIVARKPSTSILLASVYHDYAIYLPTHAKQKLVDMCSEMLLGLTSKPPEQQIYRLLTLQRAYLVYHLIPYMETLGGAAHDGQ